MHVIDECNVRPSVGPPPLPSPSVHTVKDESTIFLRFSALSAITIFFGVVVDVLFSSPIFARVAPFGYISCHLWYGFVGCACIIQFYLHNFVESRSLAHPNGLLLAGENLKRKVTWETAQNKKHWLKRHTGLDDEARCGWLCEKLGEEHGRGLSKQIPCWAPFMVSWTVLIVTQYLLLSDVTDCLFAHWTTPTTVNELNAKKAAAVSWYLSAVIRSYSPCCHVSACVCCRLMKSNISLSEFVLMEIFPFMLHSSSNGSLPLVCVCVYVCSFSAWREACWARLWISLISLCCQRRLLPEWCTMGLCAE